MNLDIQTLIKLAGIGQIALAAGSTAIPGILNWKTELKKVNPIIKQMFWVYAAYILVFNFSFGFVSAFYAKELTNGSTLSMLVTGFIAVYWISRLIIQFFVLDRANFPKGKWLALGEAVLVTLFVALSCVYSFACYTNFIRL